MLLGSGWTRDFHMTGLATVETKILMIPGDLFSQERCVRVPLAWPLAQAQLEA